MAGYSLLAPLVETEPAENITFVTQHNRLPKNLHALTGLPLNRFSIFDKLKLFSLVLITHKLKRLSNRLSYKVCKLKKLVSFLQNFNANKNRSH